MDGFELHCLYWPNMATEVIDLHRRCFEHIGVKVHYTAERVRHPDWIERILQQRLPQVNVVGFVDIDCLAYSREAIESAYRWVAHTGSFLGLAQSSGPHPTRIYAAPAFLMISRNAYDLLGRPSMSEGPEGDVAQNLSFAADAQGFMYRVLYPIGYSRPNEGQPWRLGTYGRVGIGTEYQGGFYHHFNSRNSEGFDLFRAKAEAILAGQQAPRTTPFSSWSLEVDDGESRLQPNDLSSRVRGTYRRARNRLSPHIPGWARALRNRLRR